MCLVTSLGRLGKDTSGLGLTQMVVHSHSELWSGGIGGISGIGVCGANHSCRFSAEEVCLKMKEVKSMK